MPPPTIEEWAAVRDLLKSGLLADEIPIESTAMRPKAVWQTFVDNGNAAMKVIDYDDKAVRDKFTRLLRSLRAKHRDCDLENEDKPKAIRWSSKSAAKQYLKKCFRQRIIVPEYTDAAEVWKEHCESCEAFKNMKFDSTFVRRLGSVQDDYLKKGKDVSATFKHI